MDAAKEKVYNGYLEHLLIKGLAKSTVELYAKEAKSFIEFVDDLESINNSIVYNYLQKYSHLGNDGKNKHGSALRVFLRHLSKNVYFNMNKVNIPYVKGSRKLPEILDQDEFIKRLNELKKTAEMSNSWKIKRNYALTILLYATGMRVSEALAFDRNNIENGWARIDSGKGLKDRVVPIAKEAVEALDAYMRTCPFPLGKGFFVNYKGTSMSRVQVYKILKDSIDLNPHSMRHHFATHMIINGCDVSVVSELLGHSSLITTQIYTHIKKPQLLKTVNACHPMAEENINA
ncbi:hypothetical protein FCU45_00470 [Sulfurimonas crateris]|uniref:Integrase n=1 Tax=Sulfurimonas crateris TaxID=2574727 RepID=A0A4U2Z9G3_9BACT|nr:tyrosine-type recombinase/integrase [Sulfurimonas crateris]TKI70899.1 hypothetical protein FCU45_00470 [Sulfurimonas crateris]